MPEIIDLVFLKTSPKHAFSMTEYKRIGLVFTKTRVYQFRHWAGGGGGGDSWRKRYVIIGMQQLMILIKMLLYLTGCRLQHI